MEKARELLIASKVGRMRSPWGAVRRWDLPAGRQPVRVVANGTSRVISVQVQAAQGGFEISKEDNITPSSLTSETFPPGSPSTASSCLLLPDEELFLGRPGASAPVSVSQTRM